MKLVNLYSYGRDISLFCRDNEGILHIDRDTNYFPYYYKVSPTGKYKSLTGVSLEKIFISNPKEMWDVSLLPDVYEADIYFTKKYMIDKIDKIDKSIIKYCFIDIEVLANELPDEEQVLYPISCVSLYNSLTKTIQSWYIGEYSGTLEEKEQKLLDAFINYMAKERFDLWLSWNSSFDYNYVSNRLFKLQEKSFGKLISPIKQQRKVGKIFYPAGISVVDYLQWFRKIYMREQSYTLDHIANKFLGEGKKYSEIDFGNINEDIKNRNIEDINLLVKLEQKLNLIPYYDTIRILSKVEWEDLYYNSRILEMLILEEAKLRKVVLPNKIRNVGEEETFQGAIREAVYTGVYRDIGKYDLSGAYPQMIIDFCLDSSNIKLEKEDNTIEINNYNFKQNNNTILPTVVKKLLILKEKIKSEKEQSELNSPLYKDLDLKYTSIKGVVNSSFGVFGNHYFRLYDKRITSTITFLVRDLLTYTKSKLEEQNYKVLYYDTDSMFVESKDNLTKLLNGLVFQWAKEKYNKEINLEFGYEGHFSEICIIGRCHYVGNLQTNKGIKKEIKGVEIKRKDSSKFMAKFQEELIDKLLKQKPKEEIINWIKQEMERIKTVPIEDIAFPCKLSKTADNYKNVPIFVRAIENAKALTIFKKRIGELYYYIYTLPSGNVVAFDEKKKDHVKDIDWKQMVRRNIIMKVEIIFDALKWDIKEVVPVELIEPIKKTKKYFDNDITQTKFDFLKEI